MQSVKYGAATMPHKYRDLMNTFKAEKLALVHLHQARCISINLMGWLDRRALGRAWLFVLMPRCWRMVP